MPYCNYNGNIFDMQGAVIHPDNRVLLFGEGLIETALWEQGAIKLWDYHFRRLVQSALILDIDLKRMDSAFLFQEIGKTVAANAVSNSCIVRLTVFPTDNNNIGGFLISCRKVPPIPGRHVVAGTATSVVKCADSISHIKSSSRIIYTTAMKEAIGKGWDDALILNQYGRISESTICNVFWKVGDTLYTPPLSEGCVAGVYRQHLLDTWSGKIDESFLTSDMLIEAENMYLGNAVRGLIHFKLPQI